MDKKLQESEIIKKVAKENVINLVNFNIEKNKDKGRIDRDLMWLK